MRQVFSSIVINSINKRTKNSLRAEAKQQQQQKKQQQKNPYMLTLTFPAYRSRRDISTGNLFISLRAQKVVFTSKKCFCQELMPGTLIFGILVENDQEPESLSLNGASCTSF